MKIQGEVIVWHRWLGIASCVVFLFWFVSGIVMMYARMPQLDPERRLARLPALALDQIRVSPAEAWRAAGERGHWTQATLLTIGDRPAYRFTTTQGRRVVVLAASGALKRQFTAQEGQVSANRFWGRPVQFAETLTSPDQWTVQRTYVEHLPLHRYSAQDAAATDLYVSGLTGEVVLETNRSSRFWAWLGAIPHWIYLRSLRVHAEEWRLGVIWLSGIGSVMAVLGMAAGLWRYSPRRKRYRFRDGGPQSSPYQGPKRLHHYLGLVFGVTVVTFAFSGMLSLNPGRWSSGSAPAPAQARVFQGSASAAAFVAPPSVDGPWRDAREIEFVTMWGTPVLKAQRDFFLLSGARYQPPDPAALRVAVSRASGGATIASERFLTSYGTYYYDRRYRKPLPVWEFKMADAAGTWFYVDPKTGMPVNRYEWTGRWERWLYHAFHSIDLPWLWQQRPLWDIVVILLSLGGIIVSWTGIQIGWQRLAGKLKQRKPAGARWAARVAALFLATAAWAQTSSVSGVVRDGTGAVEGVGVTLRAAGVNKAPRETTTDAQGAYRFDRLTPDRYELVFAKAGFATKTQSVVVGDGSERADIALELSQVATSLTVQATAEVSALRLDSPATGGSRLDLPVRELPATLMIVSQEMIQERGARSVNEAVDLAAGMVAGTSVGSIPSFATRGFSGNNITVMRDGMRQNTSSQSARPLDSYLFEQVEVLKGPASILYGEGAIGGAINMVSKAPTSAFLLDGIFSVGSFGTYRGGVGVSGPVGKNVFLRVDASRMGTNGYMDNSGQGLDAVGTSLRWNATERLSILVAGQYTKDSTESYYGTPLIDGRIVPRTRFLNYNMSDNLARSKNRFARLNLDWRVFGDWRLRSEGFLATHALDWRNFEAYAFNPATRLVDVSSYFLIWRDDMLLGNRLDLMGKKQIWGRTLRLDVGGQYQNNALQRAGLSGTPRVSLDPFNPQPHRDPGQAYVRDRDVQIGTSSLFVEATYELTSKLKAIGGLRYENINLKYFTIANRTLARNSYQPVTGRGGLLYSITPGINIYGSFTRAVEPVAQLVSLTGANQVFSLVPGRQAEAGVKATFWRGRADAAAAWFDIEKRDILTTTIVDGRQFNQQIGNQKARGTEASLSVRATSSLTLTADLALTNAEFGNFNENTPTGLVSRTGKLPPNVPERVLGFWANQRFGRFDLSGNVRNLGRRFADNANLRPMDGFTTVDAALGYRLPKGARLMIRGRNLGNALYAVWGVSGGTALRLEAPRSVDATFTLRF